MYINIYINFNISKVKQSIENMNNIIQFCVV